MPVVYLLNPTSNHNKNVYQDLENQVVYLLNPTSNHNQKVPVFCSPLVVYLLNPTSNHNFEDGGQAPSTLYIF